MVVSNSTRPTNLKPNHVVDLVLSDDAHREDGRETLGSALATNESSRKPNTGGNHR